MSREPSQPHTATLPVPGAALHYKLRGRGPLLLLLQGGDGDADATDRLADHLVGRYMVLTYDRRGLSRSSATEPASATDLSTHADDVSHLLAALTDQPALVFGSSIGALIGLDLVARHPEQVRLLIAHEPPATELLPEPERTSAVAAQEEVEQLYRQHGVREAMMKFIAVAGIRFDDREDDVDVPRPAPERIANLNYFLTHDGPAVRRYRLDMPALHEAAQRIVPASGADSESESESQGFAARCARQLSAALSRPLAAFPGGHTGYLLRPRAFAARLQQVLADSVVDSRPP
jgi:pimeloyl-ACP methyl ester carboxylesterase